MIRKMYHTQEYRGDILPIPIVCRRDDAWLGEGSYFWYDIDDAHDWGKKSKRRKGNTPFMKH